MLYNQSCRELVKWEENSGSVGKAMRIIALSFVYEEKKTLM
jgi:hypothetical protein